MEEEGWEGACSRRCQACPLPSLKRRRTPPPPPPCRRRLLQGAALPALEEQLLLQGKPRRRRSSSTRPLRGLCRRSKEAVNNKNKKPETEGVLARVFAGNVGSSIANQLGYRIFFSTLNLIFFFVLHMHAYLHSSLRPLAAFSLGIANFPYQGGKQQFIPRYPPFPIVRREATGKSNSGRPKEESAIENRHGWNTACHRHPSPPTNHPMGT